MISYKKILLNSLNIFISKPLVVIPSILLFLSIFFLSSLAQKIQTQFNTNSELIIFTIISALLIFLVMSFFFSLLIILSKQAFKERLDIYYVIKNSFKQTLKLFTILLIILLIYNLIQQATFYLATFIGHSFSLELNSAKFIYFILYFAGLSGILIFLSLSTFILILKEKSILESILESIKVVKQNYLFILSILVISFAISEISYLINPILNEILKVLFITPLIALIFTKLILDNDIRTK